MKKIVLFTLIAVISAFLGFRCQEEVANEEEANIIENISGQWTAHLDDGSGVEQTYQVTIEQVENTTTLNIKNFINNGETATGTLDFHTITIENQNVGEFEVEGTGTISDDMTRITWSLTIDGEPASMYFEPGAVTKTAEN